jgi:hypothetical protein
VVRADDKRRARLNCIAHLLAQVDYQDVPKPTVVLPPRVRNADYIRHPIPDDMHVPERF